MQTSVDKLKVCIIGSGNWGTCVGRLVALNVQNSKKYYETVMIWARHNILSRTASLAEMINSDHVNQYYMPNVKLPSNLIASTDICEVVVDADIIILAVVSSCLISVLDEIQQCLTKKNVRFLSLIKGIYVNDGPLLTTTQVVERRLKLPCDALSGANVASQIANDKFSSTTIACDDKLFANHWVELFGSDNFKVSVIRDKIGLELLGAMKNIIALAVGFMNSVCAESNTISSIIQYGVGEVCELNRLMTGVVHLSTYFESCGFGDLMTSCISGRNVRCAQVFAEKKTSGITWEDIERQEVGGMTLQGNVTCYNVYKYIESKNLTSSFPIISACYEIAFGDKSADYLLTTLRSKIQHKVNL